MMEMAKVTSKGQITIPISIRRRLGINEGDKILFINRPEGVMMVNPDTFQGDIAEYTAQAVTPPQAASAASTASTVPANAATVAAAEAAVAASAVPDPVKEAPAPKKVSAAVSANVAASVAAAAPPPERRYIPPMEEPADSGQTATAAKQVGNLDLSSLLDDIRSIGSKI